MQCKDEDDNSSNASYEPSDNNDDNDTISLEIDEGDLDAINNEEDDDAINEDMDYEETSIYKTHK